MRGRDRRSPTMILPRLMISLPLPVKGIVMVVYNHVLFRKVKKNVVLTLYTQTIKVLACLLVFQVGLIVLSTISE